MFSVINGWGKIRIFSFLNTLHLLHGYFVYTIVCVMNMKIFLVFEHSEIMRLNYVPLSAQVDDLRKCSVNH